MSARYPSIDNRYDIESSDFVIGGSPKVAHKAVLLQDASRGSLDLAPYTLMSLNVDEKWVPFTDETATDGTASPGGIYIGPTIAAADIVVGDISGLMIILRDVEFREDWLVIENSQTLATVIGASSVNARTVNEILVSLNLIARTVSVNTKFEN